MKEYLSSLAFWAGLSEGVFTIEAPSEERRSLATLPSQSQLLREGYVSGRTFSASAYGRLPDRVYDLVDLIALLRLKNLPPVFAFVYDQAWSYVLDHVPAVQRALGTEAIAMLPAFWAWYVRGHEEGFSPHRDRGRRSLGADGRPLTVTLWCALTDVTPEESCIYVLPKGLDPAYGKENEDVPHEDWEKLLPSVRALPTRAGGYFLWDQAILHWGSRAPFDAAPRISLGVEFQRVDADRSFDSPLLSTTQLPNFSFRLILIAKQILQYEHMTGGSSEEVVAWAREEIARMGKP